MRTIERPAEIHHSPITLLTISHTLGDIVTVHSLTQPQHTPVAVDTSTPHTSMTFTSPLPTAPVADECFEVTEENLDDFVNVCINPNGKSILRLHSVNARYVQHFVHEDRITAICYSYIKEGVGVNVIATAVEGGIVRLWSSWNLNFIMEIVTGISNIRRYVIFFIERISLWSHNHGMQYREFIHRILVIKEISQKGNRNSIFKKKIFSDRIFSMLTSVIWSEISSTFHKTLRKFN